MGIHELATNAVKYGALGQPAARLDVTWSLQPGDDGQPWLAIDWRERGVVLPDPESSPRGSGQGRHLIERALPFQLKAKTTYDIARDGVLCTMIFPVSATTPVPESADA